MSSNQGIALNSKLQYNTSKSGYENLITPEMRAYMSKFSDPLVLNFKLMIDYDKPSGLFAPETVTDSALAYLKRIGEITRFNMLKQWIEIFKIFMKNYDYLILSCDGIDEIVNKKPGHMYGDDDKITINIRETSDMFCQSLLSTYRHIWFDNLRGVEVLPANLRRFDLGVLIYSAGYYNMALYDSIENDGLMEEEMFQTKIFPTIKKLSDNYFIDNAKSYDFNHHLIVLGDAQFNNEESGKSFFSGLNNEPHDESVKNTMVINFLFASYKGIFNNIFGEFDFVQSLAYAAAYDSYTRTTSIDEQNKEFAIGGNNTKPYISTYNTVKNNFKDYFKNTGKSLKQAGKNTITELKGKPDKYLNSTFGGNGAIGNALTNLSDPELASKMIKNTIDLGIQNIEDATINKFVGKINNIILNNFSENFIDMYDKYGKKQSKNVELIINPPEVPIKKSAEQKKYDELNTQKGIRLENSNIYTRGGF